jgi:hypothetical protein
MQPVIETKVTLDGRVQSFACDGLLNTPRLAVVRFLHPAARTAGGYHFPSGSRTLGLFWRARPYNCYRVLAPDGDVIVHRFDVVDRIRIAPGRVSYRDLLLDLWVDPTGRVTVEDEDEVVAARMAGLLDDAQLRRIDRTRSLLLRDHPRIIPEIDAIVASL